MEDKLVIERIFDAPIEKVWEAWTNPEIVKKWWGPEGFSAPSIKIDLRVGGKYIYAMHGPEGSEWDRDMYSAGVYKEITPPENGYAKLVVTDYFSDENGNLIKPSSEGQDENFPEEATYSVMFEQLHDGKTKLTTTYPIPDDEKAREAILKSGMKEGWESSLNKLEDALK